MEQFNLEEHLDDLIAGKKFAVTASGLKVRIVFDQRALNKDEENPLLGFTLEGDTWNTISKFWDIDGFNRVDIFDNIVGIWEDKQPVVHIGKLPAPLANVADAQEVWTILSGKVVLYVFHANYERFERMKESGQFFATKEDAQAWLEVMMNARR